MRWINNLPLWAWFLFTMVFVYVTWNPTSFSMFHYVAYSDGAWSSRALLAIVVVTIYALYLHETYQTFNVIGAVLFLLIIAAGLWKAVDWNLIHTSSTGVWQWIVPSVVGFLLFIGLQGGRIYRGVTGRVPVSVDHHPDGHATDYVPPTHHG